MSESQSRDGATISVNNSKDSCVATSDRGSGKSSTSESAAEGEEQEDSSSNSAPSEVVEEDIDVLSYFRQLWLKDISKNETRGNQDVSVGCNVESIQETNANDDDNAMKLKAKKWFLEGVENEQNGKLHEAIKFYKKAVQLVPDIEFVLCAENKGKDKKEGDSLTDTTDEVDNKSELLADDENNMEEDDEDSNLDLMSKLQNFINRSKSICTPEQELRMTHISSLPMEIILYIFRWVVSHDLDMRSLEMCSMVCRGFYVVARDPEIWRMACIKVWGMNCGGLKNYDSWRMMFLKRPRLNYNGCYISRTTYFRHGEASFQDEYYKPWHLVEYYRYLRFFPEGLVYMVTTADKPARIVYTLKERKDKDNLHPSVLTGHYRLQDNRVLIVLQREGLLNPVNKKRRNSMPPDLLQQVYNIELQVTNHKQRLNHCLCWNRYCVTTLRGSTETKTNFEVMSSRFSSFWFARVKSYTSESIKPLV